METRRSHLLAIDGDILRIGRGFDPKFPLLPSYPPMNRRDPVTGEHDIACRARAEKTGMVLRQLDELNPALPIMNFDGSHAKWINSGTDRGSRNDRNARGTLEAPS